MTTPEPLRLITDDDLLAQRWQDLAPSPLRARGIDGLDAWRAAGHRLVLVDLGCARGGTAPVWTRPAWQRNASGLAILAASSSPDDDEGLAVLNAGASGYCHSHAPADTLRQALDVIASGELWVGRALLSRLLRLVDTRLPRTGLADWATPLTEREREVAQLAAVGDSNLSIALALGITERTVKAHLKAVFEKLDLSDRLQLALRVHGVR
jgi:DNA-binding NarL/FixJ family response regulator